MLSSASFVELARCVWQAVSTLSTVLVLDVTCDLAFEMPVSLDFRKALGDA
jgi:hypothetical protein